MEDDGTAAELLLSRSEELSEGVLDALPPLAVTVSLLLTVSSWVVWEPEGAGASWVLEEAATDPDVDAKPVEVLEVSAAALVDVTGSVLVAGGVVPQAAARQVRAARRRFVFFMESRGSTKIATRALGCTSSGSVTGKPPRGRGKAAQKGALDATPERV